ncbi:MAG: Competence protein ComM [Rhodospirillales bacterium]|nr:Competence protein ComM [Rhodospirillales bacterium]
MSLATIATFAFSGIEALPVEVQVQIAPGLPAFLLVGMADKAVGESRERVRAALVGLGLSLPPKRVLVNLAPADLLKEGSHFDLPIALGVLVAMGVIAAEEVAEYAALGELALDGGIHPVAGVLPAAIGASAQELGLICPAAQGGEAAWAGRISVLAAPDLPSLLNHFRGTQLLAPPKLPEMTPGTARGPCLSEVRGQEAAKRAIEIAAAGAHNLLMLGPPGAGKSMLAARIPGLLPDLAPAEALEVSMIHSVAGMLEGGRLVQRPPFRDPHHSASQAALVGGGHRTKPGEISLAHRGVLFLDEWPEFPRPALEALRQPMETGRATISRANARVNYPARFQLVAAMNPCRCGYLADPRRACSQAPRCGEAYQAKLSGPLLDRMDMSIEIAPLTPAELIHAPTGEPSVVVAERVARAREWARGRWGVENAEAEFRPLQDSLDAEAARLLEQAATKLFLSNRAHVRTLRVARSIADLAGTANIARVHVAEALAYRHRGLVRSEG